ncbi:MAG TPA: GH92 family glycosyl hydrolase [Holophagaceae bacterium]|nr:GH92 family glycosyl hydrolase [Holophagaceae bacterium]
MRLKALLTLIVCGLAFAGTKKPAKAGPAALVDPFIGTGGHGHTFPGASRPFGMVQPSPDTRLTGWDGCSGYHFSDSVIYGFSQRHLSGTGCSDYGDILLLPFTGAVKWKTGYTVKGEDPGPFDASGYGSHFRKATEKAEPGYYAVHLDDYGVDTELTATTRVAMHRYRFSGKDAQVLLDLQHRNEVLGAWVRVVNERTIEGFRRSKDWAVNQPVYFVATFDHPFTATIASDDAPLMKARKAEGKNLKAALRFRLLPGEALQVKVAISAVDIAGARKNLRAELPGWDFTATRKAARAAWNQELSKAAVEGGTEAQRKIFTTALYHALLQPNTFQDVDGRYLGRDLKVHKADGYTRHTVFSLWDTFRAAHPLYTLIEPKRDQDFIRTFLGEYQESGRLPVWELWANETDCMIGYHAVPVIVDAWMKGLRGFDPELTLRAMEASADADTRGLAAYKRDGYIPGEADSEDVSKTLEYAYDDWCIARLAEATGHPDDAARFYQRAQGWKHLLDRYGFMRSRIHGRFKTPFDPAEVDNHYTEANAWQYSFFVPQDLDGLIAREGGDEAFCKHLDALFSASTQTTGREQADIAGLIGQYAHGNEPSHHMAYLYDYAGQPWKTQALVRRVMDEFYKADPDGLIGNEDCGQMSAWFVLSALGIYEVCPGRPDYAAGSPLFPKATLRLDSGKTLVIRREGDGPYIQSCTRNGAAHAAAFFTHEELTAGGEIVFAMGPQPSTWGAAPADRPRSAPSGTPVVAAPVCEGPRFFSAPVEVKLVALEPGCHLFWTMDGGVPDEHAQPFTGPIRLEKSCVLRFRAEKDGLWSPVVVADFHYMDPAKRLSLRTPIHKQYDGGGPNALMDGIRGGADWKTGGWQGFYGTDLDADLDLGSVKPLRHLALGCLQDQNAWIFMPLSVSFQLSDDGQAWRDAGTIPNTTDPHADGAIIHDFAVELPLETKARYIRVHARAPITCPPWHKGAGNQSFIFCDELIAE